MMVKPNPDEEQISKIKTKLVEAYSFRDYLKTENEHLRGVLTDNHTMSVEEE